MRVTPGARRRPKASPLNRHWRLAAVALAGIATLTGATMPVNGTAVAAAASNGKGEAQTDKAKTNLSPAAAVRGGGNSEEHDGDYWAEHAGNPGWHKGGKEEKDSGKEEKDSGGKGKKDSEGESKGDSGKKDSGGKGKKFPDGTASPSVSVSATATAPMGKAPDDNQGNQGDQGDQGNEGDQGTETPSGGNIPGAAPEVPCDPNALISALTAANTNGGGSLSLTEGCTYTLTANEAGNGLPRIIQPITILGNGATITRAANAAQFRLFEVAAGGDLKVSHVTLSRGKAAVGQNGGGILVNPAGRLDLDSVTLSDNTVDLVSTQDGGAIYNEGIANIRSSTFTGNSANAGGAVYNDDGTLDISASEFSRNTAHGVTALGGALYNDGGTAKVSQSLISHNASALDGGGVYVNDGLVDIEGTAVNHNTADDDGGGIYSQGGLHVRLSTVSHNTADDDGGGLYLAAPAVIEDTKITENTAVNGEGGGIYVGGGSSVAIRRSTISDNHTPGDVATGGAGIFIDGVTDLVTLTDTKVTRNISDNGPGGINNNGTVHSFGDNAIIDNVPTHCAPSVNPVPGCFG
ncbi:right-handed parallel beta-helix repeat-containing protein [Streptomyces sp. NPDC002889]|uniref:right-handed parallel beta-helix repeat-containing protein n=1 Tax=Streptomyces sp. NPDC002889 TaxID=3364669 RepID=UPI0036CD5734